MKKNINPRAVEIQERFFRALNALIDDGTLSGLKAFCDYHDLNRPKYSRIRTGIERQEVAMYKVIDIDALAAICTYGVSAKWLLLGIGDMFTLKAKKQQS